MYDLLRAKTRGIQPDATRFLQRLVQTPSISGEEADAARVAQEAFQAAGFDHVVLDDFGNVVGVMLGRENHPALLLTSHLDTVPAPDLAVWRDSPWSGRIQDGKLYGLGAVDCKGGVAAQLYAAAVLKRALLPLEGTLIVAATVSEENGRSLGLRALLDHTLPSLDLTPSWAILGEPTNNGLYYGHDGWMEVKVEVQGVNPFEVSDAAEAIYEDLSATRAGAAPNNGAENFVLGSPRRFDDQGVRRVEFDMARRLIPGEDPSQIVHQIHHGAAASAGGATALAVDVRPKHLERRLGQLNTKVACVVDAWSTDPFCPLLDRTRQALMAAGMEARPGKWQLGRLGSGTAGSTLVRHYGIPTIGFGPGDDALAHAPNEWISLPRLEAAIVGTAVMAHTLIGLPTFGWTLDEP